jgi:hypothetical protein
MFDVNYDKSAAERLAATMTLGMPVKPLEIEGSDFVITTDDDDRVTGLDSLVINGRQFKVGLIKQ